MSPAPSPSSIGGPTAWRYAVLGHPIEHSLSPVLQRAAFEAAGIAVTCEARDVPPEELAATLGALHEAGYAAINLTAPHKEAVWPHLVGATAAATNLRAVNTLRRLDRGWEGHATDGAGFEAWVAEAAIPVRGARVVLLGAGGAARAIGPSLGALGAASVTVVAREASRAASVASLGERRNGGTAWSASALTAEPEFDDATLLVRAVTPSAVVEGEESWWRALAPEGVVIDLNYGSRAGESRDRAARADRRFEDGLGLLLHQGAIAFTFWTGREAPLGAMRRALEGAVE